MIEKGIDTQLLADLIGSVIDLERVIDKGPVSHGS